jgi:hypothetical protein
LSQVKFDYDRGIARVPRIILSVGIIGTLVSVRLEGLSWAEGFLVGVAAAWFNFYLIERFVNRLGKLVAQDAAKPRKAFGVRTFIRFTLFILGAFVILRLSGFNVVAAMCGFLVCPAAVMIEIFYELLTYGHS